MKAREDRLLLSLFMCFCWCFLTVPASNLGHMRQREKPGYSSLCCSLWSTHALPSLHQSVFSCLVHIEGPGSVGVLCENDRDRYVYSLCPETGRSFILRLKSETLLSKETALTMLKKLHQVATKLYIKWISNPYQVV